MGVKKMFLLRVLERSPSLCPNGKIVNLSGKIMRRSFCVDKNALGMKEADVAKMKLAEKAVVKPKIKAQKEAEKKLKDIITGN